MCLSQTCVYLVRNAMNYRPKLFAVHTKKDAIEDEDEVQQHHLLTCLLACISNLYLWHVLESPEMRTWFARFDALLSKMKFLNNRLYHCDITAYVVVMVVHYRWIPNRLKCKWSDQQKLHQNKQWVHTHAHAPVCATRSIRKHMCVCSRRTKHGLKKQNMRRYQAAWFSLLCYSQVLLHAV